MGRKKKVDPEQQYLDEDLAPIRVPAVDDKCRQLMRIVNARKELSDELNSVKESLISLMIDHDLTDYITDIGGRAFKFELSRETKVAAKKLKIMPQEI